jgi:5'-3' exonuclease
MGEAGAASLLYLIDALPYVFRAYFALPERLSARGHPVHAVYGFATFLIQLLRQEPLTHVAVAFDESLTTSFRNDTFPTYKANRELPPPELEQQLHHCQAVARALGFAVFVDRCYEADDLVGTLAHQAVQQGVEVVVVSNDKDLMQLVSPQVSFYDFARDRRYRIDEVRAHMGVWPEQIPDLLGLQGDAVDNIPGVQGVGAKTAVALLQAFASIEAIYADLDRVETLPIRGAKALRRKLESARDQAFLSKQLATLSMNAPAVYDAETCRYQGAIPAAIDPLWQELGFERLRQRIPHWKAEA